MGICFFSSTVSFPFSDPRPITSVGSMLRRRRSSRKKRLSAEAV
jgi:hypothetical protein